jgi:predicted HicB family RNase H-like nuclease
MRDLSEPLRSGKDHRRSSENLEWWTNRTQEDGNRQLLEQSQKALVKQPKRQTSKVFVVSDDTHRRLKEYAAKKGYKLQYIADEAIAEYLKRQEAK